MSSPVNDADSEPEDSASMFQRKLKVGSSLAQKLVAGGLTSIEDVAYIPLAEFFEVTGLGPSDAADLRFIAEAYLQNEALDDWPEL